jgi:putative IMPACT (imprinted ancient) family translation regulator
LQHGGVGDIAVVVTRYFGGIKLGKGGMVKAYTLAVQTALAQLLTVEKIDWQQLSLRFEYSQLNAIGRLLPELEAEILERKFAEQICLMIRVPNEQESRLRQQLNDLTNGKIAFNGSK